MAFIEALATTQYIIIGQQLWILATPVCDSKKSNRSEEEERNYIENTEGEEVQEEISSDDDLERAEVPDVGQGLTPEAE